MLNNVLIHMYTQHMPLIDYQAIWKLTIKAGNGIAIADI